MKVICIFADDSEFIGIASDVKSAVDFLVNNYWLRDSTEIWDDRTNEYNRIDEAMGEDWADDMAEWSIQEFNEFWEDNFTLKEVDVYGS